MSRPHLLTVPAGVFSGIVVLLILWLTLAPQPLGEEGLPVFPYADKLGHALMFGGLAFALVFDRMLWQQRRRADICATARHIGWPTLWIILAVTLFGGLIEIAQKWMELGRSCEISDFLSDAAGTVVSALVSPRIAARLLRC